MVEYVPDGISSIMYIFFYYPGYHLREYVKAQEPDNKIHS